MPTTELHSSRIFRPCDGPDSYIENSEDASSTFISTYLMFAYVYFKNFEDIYLTFFFYLSF